MQHLSKTESQGMQKITDASPGQLLNWELGCSVIKEGPLVASVRNLNDNAWDINETGTSRT